MRPIGFSASLFLSNETETSRFGAALAGLLHAGDTLLLEGPIGAGKTHLARSIIQARILVQEDVPSPTYTIVQTYDAGDLEIWHADLYRLTDASELVELGLAEAFDTALTLIEWPDRLGEIAPPDALRIRFDFEGNGRRLTLSSASTRWSKIEPVLTNA